MSGFNVALVFTMGRVGSTSVHRALADHSDNAVHLHYLNPVSLAKWEGRPNPPINIVESRRAIQLLTRNHGPVLVVSLVRDAIERNLSAAFTAWRESMPEDQLASALADDDAMADYWDGYYRDQPLRWFDQQMRDGLGVDVYQHPFPERGHVAFDEGRLRVVVIRTDLPDETKASLLAKETGWHVRIPTENAANRSADLADLYLRFSGTAPLDADYVRTVAESQYQQHFFGTDPDAYVERWTRS